MDEERTISERDAWTTYWRTGQAASCFDGAEAEVQFSEIWRSFVAGFSDGARLIDLAAGNGAAVLMCAAQARALGVNLRFDAVDAAEIDPKTVATEHPQRGDVAFHGNVKLEDLPFPDGSFEGALSQFGFEYAEEAAAASEVARVLASNGRVRLVMHAKEGAVCQGISQRLARLERMMAENGPMALVRAMARAAVVQDWATVQRQSARLPAAIVLFKQISAGAPPDDAAVFYSGALLGDWTRRDRYRPTDLNRAIESGWRNAMGVATRQRQMLEAARSGEDIAALCACFERLGLRAAAPEAIADSRGRQIAWLVDAAKAQN